MPGLRINSSTTTPTTAAAMGFAVVDHLSSSMHSVWSPRLSTTLHLSPATAKALTDHAPTILIFFAVVCVLLPLHSFLSRRHASSKHHKPSIMTLPAPALPQLDPIFGLSTIIASYLALSKHSLLDLITHRFTTTGHTYTARMLNTTMIATCSPENLRALLGTQFTDFELGDRRKDAFRPLLGHSIFASDGPTWKAARAALRPSFAKDRIANGIVGRHAEALIAAMNRSAETSADGFVDLQPLFFRLSLDIATEFFFGESCGSLRPASAASEQAEKFAKAFNTCQQTLVDDFVLGPVARILPHWSFRRERKVIYDFVEGFVVKAVQEAEEQAAKRAEVCNDDGKETNVKETSILADLAMHSRDPAQLRDQALSLLVAGRDTTASLLSNLWFVLSQRPDIFRKLADEVDALAGRTPDISELKDMKYLQNCLRESLRLHPPVPVNIRQNPHATTLPVGGGPTGSSPIAIPAHTIVSYSVYAMHRRTDLWGDDAAEFQPERWESTRRPGWEFLPFNGGSRVCLGQQLALAEAGCVTVRLVQEFRKRNVALTPKIAGEWREHLSLTCCVEGGVHVKVGAGR